jgi:hypothetical protein
MRLFMSFQECAAHRLIIDGPEGVFQHPFLMQLRRTRTSSRGDRCQLILLKLLGRSGRWRHKNTVFTSQIFPKHVLDTYPVLEDCFVGQVPSKGVPRSTLVHLYSSLAMERRLQAKEHRSEGVNVILSPSCSWFCGLRWF